jgi:uncharacterized protein YqeY
MPIVDEVASQLKQAMRDQDKPRLQALRNIRAAFLEALKVEGAPDALPDTEAEGILRRLAKQRRESIEAYDAGNREDLAASERAELAVVESFLPQLADQGQTETWVTEAIAATGASGPGDLGRVMGHLMKNHKDQLDGKLANQIARRALS